MAAADPLGAPAPLTQADEIRVRSRAGQGLSPVVTDPSTLVEIAVLLRRDLAPDLPRAA